jgi:hypothetical protein
MSQRQELRAAWARDQKGATRGARATHLAPQIGVADEDRFECRAREHEHLARGCGADRRRALAVADQHALSDKAARVECLHQEAMDQHFDLAGEREVHLVANGALACVAREGMNGRGGK